MPECIHCRQKLPNKEELKGHLRNVHRSSSNKLARTCISCPPPGNVFADLEGHFALIHGLKEAEEAKCDCGRTFKTRVKRNVHARDCDTSGIER